MSRESLLDEAIAKAKKAEDWQLVEWLRMARGGQSAVRWYTEKLRELEEENTRLRSCLSEDEENARLIMGESAKLREQGERLFAKTLELKTENDRLRELIQDMYACISHANEQDWFYFERDKFGCGMSCTVNGEACGLSVLAGRMRELGVEVEG